jgi:nicotinic acid mononucleotide adenylyltransferase
MWKNWRKYSQAGPVGADPDTHKKLRKIPAFEFFDSPQSDASSSEIRRMIREGRSLEGLTTASLEFILRRIAGI